MRIIQKCDSVGCLTLPGSGLPWACPWLAPSRPGPAPGLPRAHPGPALGLPRACSGLAPGLPWGCPGPARVLQEQQTNIKFYLPPSESDGGGLVLNV